jgi:uncharacterized protein YcaQ
MQISIKEARFLALNSQRLLNISKGKTKRDLFKIIEAIGYVQIDTISIVERAHHHILWTRMPAYKRTMLDELLEKDKKIFEYWSHAAAFLPMKDYRFSFYRQEKYRKNYEVWAKKNRKIVNHVLDRIKAEGALQSKDFEHTGKRGNGWWDWKPAKYALQHLFHEGTLMIASRKGFQKVYDLTENVLPKETDTTIPTEEEFHEHMILGAINSYGFAAEKEIKYQRANDAKILKSVINKLKEENRIVEFKIKGIESQTYYSAEKNLKRIKNAEESSLLHILSPFDNLIIQRKRTKNIFDFNYTVEFYLPASKRTYGYYCMPVLYGSKFIGKIDAKANRQTGIFEIINYFPENKKFLTLKIKEGLREKITELSIFTGCEEVNWNNRM